MSKFFLGKLFSGKGKVSPTIKSVKPNLKKTGEQTRTDEYRKRYKALDKSQAKIKTGRQMMREGQKERKRMVDTGKAFQFKNIKTFHAIKPGEKDTYMTSMKVAGPQKKFKKGKELEKKAIGGRVGRKFGNPKPKTNIQKIKETFAPKGKIKFDAKKSDLDKSGELSKYEKARGMAIAKAMAKRKKNV